MDNTQKKPAAGTVEALEKRGICVPEILLPSGVDLCHWAVIACDQFTQDRSYWEKVKDAAGNAGGNADGTSPSTLNLIFPEVFLEDHDRSGRIEGIHQSMRRYLDQGIFAPYQGFVYLERDTAFNRGRRGLVAAIDLERYDWAPSARPLIRSTEATVPERLPPRMDIRRGAPIELPHILLLIDDKNDSLLPALAERAKKSSPVYQGELMLDSGSITGWFLDAEEDGAFLAEGFQKLSGTSPSKTGEPFLFAVGDGNHSLASAKEIWEEYKREHENGSSPQGNLLQGSLLQGNLLQGSLLQGNLLQGSLLPIHPCRYALVEIENIYDPAIQFEPIHRVIFGMDFDDALTLLAALPGFSSQTINDRNGLVRLVSEPVKGNRFGIISGGHYAVIETSAGGIATVCLQPLLDKAMSGKNGLSIDYIHGAEELFRLAVGTTTGILLPPVQKAGFFDTIADNGPLPRKSFSMGEAEEKRFYIECRKLFG